MRYGSRSYIGTRSEQQDRSGIVDIGKGFLAVVCDGMGGRNFGADVAEASCDEFCFAFTHRNFDDYVTFASQTAEDLDKSISRTYYNKGGCTLATAFIKDNTLEWYSVGDSRLYLCRDGVLKLMTEDNNYFSLLKRQLENNEITEQEYLDEASKGRKLMSFLGANGLSESSQSSQPFVLHNKDRILLTSDGLYNAVRHEELCSVISDNKSVDEICDCLYQMLSSINDRSVDNSTYILIEIEV